MKFEQPHISSQEKIEEINDNEQETRIQVTKEDLHKYNKSSVNKEELQKWMDEKGISFDCGMIKISLDGVNHLFNTNQDDFGTISYPEDEIGGGETIPAF